MAGENTFLTLQSLFKKVYADKLVDLVPNYAVLQQRISFDTAVKLGDLYEQPVNLSSESGFTYNGENGAIASLTAPNNGVMKSAQVRGSELILRAQLGYVAITRAAEQGERAFKKATAWKIEDMNNSMRKRLEIAMLYGQTDVGEVSSLSSQDIILTAASWAGGIWAGTEGQIIDVYNQATNNVRQAGLVILAVNSDTRTLTVTGTTTGIVAGDLIQFKGARTTGSANRNEMAGLKKILTNTGTLFNIDASAYSLWKGNTLDVSGRLTFEKLNEGIAKCVDRGLMDDLLLLVNPKVFGMLNSDQAALRSYDAKYSSSKSDQGFEGLTYHGVAGKVEVVSHPFVKQGDAFAVPSDFVTRVGSVDLSFGVPGTDLEYFERVPGSNAVEIQCMADQAIFVEKPAHGLYMQNIS
jgi:hypothetical protein